METESNREDEPKSKRSNGNDPGTDDPLPTPPPVSHAPIIITGEGSVGLEFERKFYGQSGSTHQSSALFLDFIEIRKPLPDGSLLERCHTLAAGEVCLVKVKCRQAPKLDEEIRVLGGKSQSPVINFDSVEFGEISEPADPRRKHFNTGRKIIELTIFRVINGVSEQEPFHKCSFVPDDGKCMIIVRDKHPSPE